MRPRYDLEGEPQIGVLFVGWTDPRVRRMYTPTGPNLAYNSAPHSSHHFRPLFPHENLYENLLSRFSRGQARYGVELLIVGARGVGWTGERCAGRCEVLV